MRSGRHSMLNFGFNYTKSKNFDQILTAAGRLNNASQNKLSAMKNANGVYTLQDKNNGLVSNSGAYSQADYLIAMYCSITMMPTIPMTRTMQRLQIRVL